MLLTVRVHPIALAVALGLLPVTMLAALPPSRERERRDRTADTKTERLRGAALAG